MIGRRPKPIQTRRPGKPRPPEQLKGRALEEWNRVAPQLFKNGFLSKIDAAELAFYCTTFARWQDAEEIVAAAGILIQTKNGNVIQHPALGVANTAMKLCHRFATEFGLSPCSRHRLSMDDVPLGTLEF